jgi:threonine dehydrogenase-like Zn-dependent dehydrogenase
VAVVGAGTLGLVAAQAARARGADVLVVEPRKEARELAASLGLVAVERPDGSHGESFDVVVEASGSTVGLVSAIGLAASGGRVAQLGTPHHAVDGVPVADLVVRDLSVVGVLSGVGHWEELVDLVVAGHVDLDAMVDRVVPLEDVRSAYERLADPLRVRPKVLLDFMAHPTTDLS